MKFPDRLRVTTTATDTSVLTLGGATSKSFWTLAKIIAAGGAAVGDTVSLLVDDEAGNWEISTYTITNSVTLTRTAITASSNGGAAVAFAPGTKTVAATSAPSDGVSVGGGNTGNTGNSSATSTVVAPSGVTTGEADLAAIQAALLAGGRVTLQPGGQFYVNGPITLPSNSHLTAYGAKIRLVAGVFGNILRNKAVLPSRTVSDANVINPGQQSGNATLTSLTANFVAGDVGSMLGMFGGGAGANASVGAAWYGTILSVTTPATATAWAATVAKTAGALGRPTAANGNLYQVTTAGTTGSTQPTWPTGAGNTVQDGTVTWTCLGAATGATLNQPSLNAVTNGTANVYAAADRNDNITIQGGDWTITENLGGGHITTSTFQNSFASAFRRVSNLRIKDTTWTTYGPVNQGGRFTISIADFSNVTVDGTNFIATAGDGVHMTGPGDAALVTNTRGTTGDDTVVTNMQDSNTPYIMDTEGSLANITVRDLVCKNGGSRGFCHYDIGQLPSGTVPARWTAKNLHVEKISGITFNPLVLIQTAVDGLVIRNITGAPNQAATPLIDFMATSGNGAGVTIEDVTWTSLLAATNGIIRIQTPRGPHHVKNLRFAAASAGTNYGIYMNGTLNGSGFGIPALTLDGFYTGNSVSSPFSASPADATAIYFGFSTASSGTTTLNVKNCFCLANTGFIVQKTNPGAISRISISDSFHFGTALVGLPSGDASAPVITLNSVRSNTAIVQTQSPITVEATNCDFASSAALVQLTGTGATPANIRLANSAQSGAGALVSRDGTQSIRVRGTDIPVDQTLLTPADGDMIYNSNATPGNGTGPAIWNAAAAKWKNLYSGLTN